MYTIKAPATIARKMRARSDVTGGRQIGIRVASLR
jgi:hypothetical protein